MRERNSRSLLNNKITTIRSDTFAPNDNLNDIFLSLNGLKVITSGTFTWFRLDRDQTIFLSDNPIKVIEHGAFEVPITEIGKLTVYLLRTELRTLSLESFIGSRRLEDSKLSIRNRALRILSYWKRYNAFKKERLKIYLNPLGSIEGAVVVRADKQGVVSSLVAAGFTELGRYGRTILRFLPCPLGTFSNSSSKGAEGCLKCPPGGFYSDIVGHVDTSCKKCPNGSFVAFEEAPGTQFQDCKTCPLGTQSDLFAGLRACTCLEGHYRTHMFEKCEKCGIELKCKDEYAALNPGYWWSWRNDTHKTRYRAFIANLLASSPLLGEEDITYPYSLPTPYQCPLKESCKGGTDSTCMSGYKGPLCSVCGQGYYKQLHLCKTCPTKAWMAVQIGTILAILLFVAAVCVWMSKRGDKKVEGQRSVVDNFLSKIKIVIGFYQVTYGLLEAFSFIEWPQSVQVIGKYSEILQLNILQVAPVQCFISGMQADALERLVVIMAINAAIIVIAGLTYGVRRIIITRNKTFREDEKLREISEIKETVYKNVFFFLYVTYLSTCSQTATVLPFACKKLCQDLEEELCVEYLKSDYSVQCHYPRYKTLVFVAYLSSVYVVALPITAFIVLWRHKKAILAASDTEMSENLEANTEVIRGLGFLYENYNASSWYWELVEMSRKVIITSGLIVVGQDSRSYIGLAWVITGMYGALFAWNHPIPDVFEDRVMTISIAVTVFNLGVGAVSKIPAENLPSSTESFSETVVFSVLILGANTLVIALLAFQYVVHLYNYLREWRKNPHCSFSCCLALVLPLLSMPGDIRGLVGADMINKQLDGGNVEKPTITAVVQETGVMDVTLEEGEKGDGIVEETGALPQTGQMEAPSCNAVAQEIGAVGATLKSNGELMEVRNGNYPQNSEKNNKKCHQGAQTELSINCALAGATVHGSMDDEPS